MNEKRNGDQFIFFILNAFPVASDTVRINDIFVVEINFSSFTKRLQSQQINKYNRRHEAETVDNLHYKVYHKQLRQISVYIISQYSLT